MRRVVLLAVVTVLLAACGGDDVSGIAVGEARIGQPTGPNAALYFTATNDSDGADALVGAATDAASSVELHETTMGDDGSMGMQALDAPLEVAAGGTLLFEPGGFHLMLIQADRMEIGDTIEVTLTWENAGKMTIEAEVVDPGDTMRHDDMDMDEDDS